MLTGWIRGSPSPRIVARIASPSPRAYSSRRPASVIAGAAASSSDQLIASLADVTVLVVIGC
jgi:hypothetical protein